MRRIVLGNWKMNLNIRQAELLASRLKANIKKPTANIVLCPNSVCLSTISNLVKSYGDSTMSVGAQNIYDKDEGPYTGEVSGAVIKGLADYCIVGHSERRVIFGESDDLIASKVAACFRNNIIPVLCVGENLKQRHEKIAKNIVIDQLEQDLSEIIAEEVKNVVVAYEPVWAIGTGENASPYDVEEMLIEIQKYLFNKYRDAIAPKVRIIYGGSVKGENAKSYLDLPQCDGLLVGGASLNYHDFSKICQLG